MKKNTIDHAQAYAENFLITAFQELYPELDRMVIRELVINGLCELAFALDSAVILGVTGATTDIYPKIINKV